MFASDFEKYDINHFSVSEVTNHVDLGKIRMWTAFKKTRKDSWKYLDFFQDPKRYGVK